MKTTNSISQFCLFLVLSFFGTLLCASTAVAQYTPEKGSVERKAITDTLRVPVEKKLKQSVVFNIDHLKAQDEWAFMLGAPRKPGGGKLDYSKTSYAKAVALGMFDDNISALLHKVRGRWRVVRYVIGATDVVYLDWDSNIAHLQESSRNEIFCSRFYSKEIRTCQARELIQSNTQKGLPELRRRAERNRQRKRKPLRSANGSEYRERQRRIKWGS